jgi:dTDP-4-dehydrorhamnose reductase
VRVLVTGAGGLVGGRLALLLAQQFTVVVSRHRSAPPAGLSQVALDLLSAPSIENALSEARPDAVVHAAALAEADLCEADPARAIAVNAAATAALGRACRARAIRWVAISTDLVFGDSQSPRTEDDVALPLSVYGRTKLDGEEFALDAGAVVVRIPLIVGRGYGPRATATESVAWALRAARQVRLYTDQYRAPVDPDAVADAMARILRRGAEGRFHLGGLERLSRFDLGRRVAATLGLDGTLITPISQGRGARALRPGEVVLAAQRARRDLGWEPGSIDEAIRRGRPSPPASL